MPYRNKTFVSFDGDKDMHYYRLMQAWHQSDHSPFTFYNAHDINTARDSSQEQSIKNQLRERLLNSKQFILLIGERTRYLTKFVQWEIEQAIRLDLPIIAVNLNGLRQQDAARCPPALSNALAIHVSYNPAILQYALEHWPPLHASYRTQRQTGGYFFLPGTYQSLGL